VFMDEAGVNLAMIQMYARAPKGQRAVGSRPSKRGQNVSLESAYAQVTLNDIRGWFTKDCYCTSSE